MATEPNRRHRMSVLFHSLGLSCLGGAMFLEVLVFIDIIQHGYFMAVEANTTVLATEMTLTIFALVYFIYIFQRFVRTIR